MAFDAVDGYSMMTSKVFEVKARFCLTIFTGMGREQMRDKWETVRAQ